LLLIQISSIIITRNSRVFMSYSSLLFNERKKRGDGRRKKKNGELKRRPSV
jgi:hypothetical protein